MTRTLICLALVAVASLLHPSAAGAAESYDNCTGFITSIPATITTQGTWCMNADLSTAITDGTAITVATNNVIIDCNDFKLGGLAAGPGTTASGIASTARLNTTVRNCNIRGFSYGVNLNNGAGHVVEDNRFDGVRYLGAFVEGAGSTVRNNLFNNTGGSTVFQGLAYGIYVRLGVGVINNTVNGVDAIGANADAYGINTESNGNGSVIGNEVRGLVPSGNGVAYGVYNVASGRTVVRGNTIQGPGALAGGIGVRCLDNQGTAAHNVVAGFATAVQGCLDAANTLNPN